MSMSKDFIYGMAHYWIALIRFRRGEYGWVKAHWHFLLAYEYLSKTDSAYLVRCAKYLSLIDERNRAREKELEKIEAVAGMGRRISRIADKNNGDLRDVNLAMFLTCPESLLTTSKGRQREKLEFLPLQPKT